MTGRPLPMTVSSASLTARGSAYSAASSEGAASEMIDESGCGVPPWPS
jgi:hypothetical protein